MPVVCSKGTVTYGVATEIANVLKPLVGHSAHHIKNTQAFVEQVKSIGLEQGECITFYDVNSVLHMYLWTAISIIKNKLEQDTELHNQNFHVHTTHHFIVGFLP